MDDFFNGRGFLAVAAIIAVAVALATGNSMPAATGIEELWQGVFFSFSPAVLPLWAVKVINIICLGGIATLLILLNKQFNVVRAYTFNFSAVFLLFSALTLWLKPGVNVGLLMCLALVVVMFIIFGEYQNRGHSQRSIFLSMVIVGICCLFHYGAAVLILVVFIGFSQVRAMSWRGVVAMSLGLLTPVWVLVGSGIVNPLTDFNLPDVSSIWSGADLKHLQLPFIVAALTAFLTITVTTLNLMTVLNYRLQTRMYNAFIVVLAVIDVVAMCVDFTHILTYLPILNLCLAIQIAHRATTGRRQLLS